MTIFIFFICKLRITTNRIDLIVLYNGDKISIQNTDDVLINSPSREVRENKR
ncbi:hypothetical protein C1646_713845 [Rhizophagus diaphanus]|nr:hypothetical protein C1646_713845 [Rhizophagus diaphanus] [Rhizophagus sp. MUCL 43196]